MCSGITTQQEKKQQKETLHQLLKWDYFFLPFFFFPFFLIEIS